MLEMWFFQLSVGVKASLVESQQMSSVPFILLSCCFHVPFIPISCCIHFRSCSFHFAFMSFHVLSKVEMALSMAWPGTSGNPSATNGYREVIAKVIAK